MAYDTARGVTVLFGGYDGISNRGETWEWNGSKWTLRATDGPSPRREHAMAYDSVRGMAVLFGGRRGTWGDQDKFGDTWEWDGVVWTLRLNDGPSPRFAHAMAYDSARGVTVLFGGSGQKGFSEAETWEWDGSAWAVRASDGPVGLYDHAMTYDRARGVVVSFGGGDEEFPLGGTWEFGPISADCNFNAIADECDIAWGAAGDCDANGVPDSCEHPGDFDCDGDVDDADFNTFRGCFAGPLQPPLPDCGPMDLDSDGDVDCADWRILRDRWTTGEPPSFGRCPRATAVPVPSEGT
jgi:hypothetical protein